MRHARLIALLLASAALPGAFQSAAAQDAPAAETPTVPVPAAPDQPRTCRPSRSPPRRTCAALSRSARRGLCRVGSQHPIRAVLILHPLCPMSAQLHRVEMPMGARTQISFEGRAGARLLRPGQGRYHSGHQGSRGDEYYQLHTLKDGRLTLLTDGKSRNQPNAWSQPTAKLVGFSSTRRNGVACRVST